MFLCVNQSELHALCRWISGRCILPSWCSLQSWSKHKPFWKTRRYSKTAFATTAIACDRALFGVWSSSVHTVSMHPMHLLCRSIYEKIQRWRGKETHFKQDENVQNTNQQGSYYDEKFSLPGNPLPYEPEVVLDRRRRSVIFEGKYCNSKIHKLRDPPQRKSGWKNVFIQLCWCWLHYHSFAMKQCWWSN